jgi:IS30 family transposase
MFMTDYAGVNSARTCILTLLELNSRFVYARALTKATSAKTAEAMTDILLQNAKDCETKANAAPILKLRTDNGSEFAGDFARLLAAQGIEHDHAEAETHTLSTP